MADNGILIQGSGWQTLFSSSHCRNSVELLGYDEPVGTEHEDADKVY